MSHKDILIKTDLLLIQFQKLHLPSFETLLSFRPIVDKNEIDMENFESYLQLSNPSLSICYPIADIVEYTFDAVLTDTQTDFQKNAWGIEEPNSDEIVAPETIDIVFVPLLSFDKKGFRIGYGKGFYDKFLSQCRQDIIKVGFSFFPPEESIPEIMPYDIPLNYGITPEEIYVFS